MKTPSRIMRTEKKAVVRLSDLDPFVWGEEKFNFLNDHEKFLIFKETFRVMRDAKLDLKEFRKMVEERDKDIFFLKEDIERLYQENKMLKAESNKGPALIETKGEE